LEKRLNEWGYFKETIIEDINKNIILGASKKKSTGSFGELLWGKTSVQSINIKMGNVLERSWNVFLDNITDVIKIDKGMEYGSQIDVMFSYKDTVFYFESKNNVNLDTEKTIATKEKIVRIEYLLEKDYPDKIIISKVLSNRNSRTEMVNFYKKPFTQNDFYGYSDFFDIFSIDVSKKDWETFFFEQGKRILEETNK